MAAGALLALATCAPTAWKNSVGRDNLLRRAQFDLRCPADQLRLTALQFSGELVTSYGVTGCGQQATYLLGPKETFEMDRGSRPVNAAAPDGSVR